MTKRTSEQVAKAFWKKVNKNGAIQPHCPELGRCWLWMASLRDKKYGQFWLNGKNKNAHVAAWILTFGAIPNNLYVLHKCDNKLCVNPDHLYIGSQKQNIEDAVKKGRMGKLTPNVLEQLQKEYLHVIEGELTLKELAIQFGVTDSAIRWVIKRDKIAG